MTTSVMETLHPPPGEPAKPSRLVSVDEGPKSSDGGGSTLKGNTLVPLITEPTTAHTMEVTECPQNDQELKPKLLDHNSLTNMEEIMPDTEEHIMGECTTVFPYGQSNKPLIMGPETSMLTNEVVGVETCVNMTFAHVSGQSSKGRHVASLVHQPLSCGH